MTVIGVQSLASFHFAAASCLFQGIETIIYLMDKTGLHFEIEDGHVAEAGELFEYVMEELKLPTQAREVFSLWLVSDLLGMEILSIAIQFILTS